MIIGKIEKKVKIPTVHSKNQYPWGQMEVGDSVFIEAEKGRACLTSSGRLVPLHGTTVRRPGRN